MKQVYQYMAIFFNFFNQFKSSSSTTSRELRHQFAACSGWDDNDKFRLERFNMQLRVELE